MKIAYVINQYPQASQTFIRREIVALEQLGVEVHRFTVRRWSQQLVDRADQAEEAKTRAVLEGSKLQIIARLLGALFTTACSRPANFFFALCAALRLGRRAHRRLLHLIYLAEACVLRRWIAGVQADHIHAHFGTNSTAVAMLIHALGGPAYSFTVHGPEEFDRPVELALDEKMRHAAMAVAVSEFGRSQLLRWARPENWPKIQVIRCGIDESFLAAALPPPVMNRKLLCIGRLAEQKGQLILIEAMALLVSRGVDLELLLLGDGPMRGQIEARIAQHRLGAKVRLAGWMTNEQIRAELFSARALVLPSFAEGLPVVLMEALALARPVIATYIAGIPELVTSECGWLVPAGDVEALASAMETALAANEIQLAKMAAAGAARVRELHDASRQAKKLLDAITHLTPSTVAERIDEGMGVPADAGGLK